MALRRWSVPLVTMALIGVALTVLWLGNTTAYEPDGHTRCGPAIQEFSQLFDEVRGRCHLARQDRLRLGLRMAAAMALAGAIFWGGLQIGARRQSSI